MRRPSRSSKRIRLKILEARKNGMAYEEIRRKYGVSLNTISKLVKGKSLLRYCSKCGETNPGKLEERHPDRANLPGKTITLCANCHSELHRKQPQENKEKRQHGQITPGGPDAHASGPQTPLPSLTGQRDSRGHTPRPRVPLLHVPWMQGR